MISQRILDTIKRAVPATEAGRALGLRIGSDGRCPCPFHDGHDNNLKLYDNRNNKYGYYCFVCHKGGDVISLTQKVLGCSFRDAAGWINSTFNLHLDIDSEADSALVEAAGGAIYEDEEDIDDEKAYELTKDEFEAEMVNLCFEVSRLIVFLCESCPAIRQGLWELTSLGKEIGLFTKIIGDDLRERKQELDQAAAESTEASNPAQPEKEEQ